MSTTTEKNVATERDPKIEAIKEIIFGENIKEINREFDEMKASIQEHRKALDDRMSHMRQELENTIQQLQQHTDKEMKAVQEDTLKRLSQLEGSVPSNTNLGKMFERDWPKIAERRKEREEIGALRFGRAVPSNRYVPTFSCQKYGL